MALLDDLISYWKLDEASGSATDSHGSNTLTSTNSVGSSTGIISNARTFNGTSQDLRIASNASLQTGDIDFTFSTWVYINSFSTSQDILGKWGTNSEYLLAYSVASNRFLFIVQTSGGTSVSAVANNFGAPSINTWYHLTGWHDSVNNVVGIAVNAGTADTTSHTGGVRSGANAFVIGYRDGAGSSWTNGRIDETGFWKRVLTSTERSDLYNSGSGLDYDSFGGAVGTITLTTPQANQIIQRTGTTFAGGTASISISGTYTETPTSIEARFAGGTWAVVDAAPTGGTFSGTLTSQAAGQGAVEVRFSNDTGVTDSVADVGIGEIFAVFGQSNAVCLATNPQSWSAPASYSHYKPGRVNLGDDWAVLADHPFDATEVPSIVGKGSCYPRLATLLMEELGVPVGFVCVGKGTTGLIGGSEDPKLNHWDKDGIGVNAAEQYDKAVATVNSNEINDVRAILWYQGEADTLGTGAGNNAGRVAYAAAVSQLLDDFQADCAALADSPMIVATLAEYVRADTSTSDLTDIRMAQVDAVNADASLYLGPIGYEQDFSDDGHWLTDTQITRLGNLWYNAIDSAIFGATNETPKIVSAVENGARDEITLTFDRDLLSSDTTYTNAAFAVENNSTARAITSVTRTGTRTAVIVITSPLVDAGYVSLGRGNLAVGATLPRSANVTLPDSTTINLVAAPFERVETTPVVPTITVDAITGIKLATVAFDVTWSSSDLTGNVDILLSQDNGATFPVTLVSGTANDGTYSYTPDEAHIAAQASIRVRSSSDNDIFDDSSVFVIATTTPGEGGGGAWKALAKSLAIEAGYEVFET